MALAMIDGIISPLTFKYAGKYHKAYIKWLFGDEVSGKEILGLDGLPDESLNFEKPRIEYWENNILNNRAGVEIIDLRK